MKHWGSASTFLIGILALTFFSPAALPQSDLAKAGVIVVVDNSGSISAPGLDPERTSLLVARLLSDIVPGDLAVIRTLDLGRDGALLPSKRTGRTFPCKDLPGTCYEVQPATDWVQAVRDSPERAGLLARPNRGDRGYKERLEKHLTQNSGNSMFGLAFETADVYFLRKPSDGNPKVLVWLSDGDPEDKSRMAEAVGKLKANGVQIETVIFGNGKTTDAKEVGLDPKVTHNPAELMKAFADIFRVIVDAPYRIDNTVAVNPTFEMKPLVSEAWVIVYGDETLGEVTVDSPNGTKRADYAEDHFHQPGVAASAGGYKVLYVTDPPPGNWTIHASGGGNGVAYAVIQRSSLFPVYREPATASVGVPVTLVAGIATARSGAPFAGGSLPKDLTVTAEWEGQSVVLNDDGTGRFSAKVTFTHPGAVPVTIRLRGDLIRREAIGKVQVSSFFRYKGGPITLDYGPTQAGSGAVCRPIALDADQEGEVSLTIQRKRRLPDGHSWELRSARGITTGEGRGLTYQPGDRLELCLVTTPGAYSSVAKGEVWLEIGTGAEGGAPVRASWKVSGISWLKRNLNYILGVLGFILFCLWVYGFIWPIDFPGRLAIQYAAEQDELEEQQAQPFKSVRSVRKGWYRHARAFFHADYRLNRKPRGALVAFRATPKGVTIQSGPGNPLYRLDSEGQWAPLPSEEQRAAMGEIYRSNERGPFLRLEQKGSVRV